MVSIAPRRKKAIDISWLEGCSAVDTLSKERRSANMAAIRSKDTKPEVAVRKILFQNGVRYRLHPSKLPGKPDIVVPSVRLAIFVHGCFWHGCKKCVDGRRRVKSNTSYWSEKIGGNQARDKRNRRALSRAGWHILTIWECEIAKGRRLDAIISRVQRLRDTIPSRYQVGRVAGKRLGTAPT